MRGCQAVVAGIPLPLPLLCHCSPQRCCRRRCCGDASTGAPRRSGERREAIPTHGAYASHLPSLRDYFRKLERLVRKYNLKPEDIFNMDEKGFIIGRSSRAKVVCRAGRRPPRVTQDGTQEMLTVVECCCAAQHMLPSFVILKGTAQYMG